MGQETTRLRVKLGAAEIDYEGSEEFLRQEVLPQISEMLKIVGSHADLRQPAQPLQLEARARSTTLTTTNTLGGLLGASSAADLAVAAIARLTILEGRESVGRLDILTEMKTAPQFFKQSFVNNHSNTIKAVLKSDKVRLVGPDQYSLSSKARRDIEQRLDEQDDY